MASAESQIMTEQDDKEVPVRPLGERRARRIMADVADRMNKRGEN